MYARGIPFDLLDGESPAADTAVLDRALTPSDAGPIEVIFEPKVLYCSYSLCSPSLFLTNTTVQRKAFNNFGFDGSQRQDIVRSH